MLADDLITYLQRNLSATAYGGIYKEMAGESSAKVVIWVVDTDEYDHVLDGYRNEMCEIEVKESSCSLSDMQAMKKSISAIEGARKNIPNMDIDEQTNRLKIELFEKTDSNFTNTFQQLIDSSEISNYIEVGTAAMNNNS